MKYTSQKPKHATTELMTNDYSGDIYCLMGTLISIWMNIVLHVKEVQHRSNYGSLLCGSYVVLIFEIMNEKVIILEGFLGLTS